MQKVGFLFGAGAEICYGLPTGGKFALDIFRQDVSVSKKECLIVEWNWIHKKSIVNLVLWFRCLIKIITEVITMDYNNHNTTLRTNKHLNFEERFYLEKRIVLGDSIAAISRVLGRSRTTIYT